MSNELIRTVVVDDQEIIILGSREFFSKQNGYDLVGTAQDGEALIELCKKESPQLAFIDIRMPDVSGLTIAKKLITETPDIKIILISSFIVPTELREIISIGAFGFLAKDDMNGSVHEELKRKFFSGKKYFSKAVYPLISELVFFEENKKTLLTAKQREVYEYLKFNWTFKSIAEKLGIKQKTVEDRTYKICHKLSIKGGKEMIAVLYKEGKLPE